MKKYLCISQYGSQFIIGNLYNSEIYDDRYCKIKDIWFVIHSEDEDFAPLLSDFFISLSECRKMKLKKIETNLSRQNGEKMARNNKFFN